MDDCLAGSGSRILHAGSVVFLSGIKEVRVGEFDHHKAVKGEIGAGLGSFIWMHRQQER